MSDSAMRCRLSDVVCPEYRLHCSQTWIESITVLDYCTHDYTQKSLSALPAAVTIHL